MAKQKHSGQVVAKEAIVIVVGARPPVYGTIMTRDRRSGEMVEVENQNEIVDEGASGVSYAFKPMQKVSANHPAVKDCPGAFMPLADLDEADLDLVTT